MSNDESVPDLYRLAFMPGQFLCPKCKFKLSKSTISATSGQIGTKEADRESEPCPNDGTIMVHVTYKEEIEGYSERLKEEFNRRDEWRKLLQSASYSLRSYKYGNAELAEEIANKIDKELRKLRYGMGNL